MGTGLAVWRGARPITRGFAIDQLLRYLFIFPLRLQGLWAFAGHVFFPEQSAAGIGWPPIAALVLLFFSSKASRPKSPATLALEAELEAARKAMREYRNACSNLGK